MTARHRPARQHRDTDRDLREAILDSTGRLLAERRFDQVSVADILSAAGVSRASFYFYFASRHEVLAELVRRAVSRGHEAARPWLSHTDGADRAAALRAGIVDGARLWQDQAPVLRAMVENWRTDPRLTQLWLEQMGTFTAVTTGRIDADRAAGAAPAPGVPTEALAAALTWLGERLYYLAAVGVPPFDDRDTLVEVLTTIWLGAVYRERPDGV